MGDVEQTGGQDTGGAGGETLSAEDKQYFATEIADGALDDAGGATDAGAAEGAGAAGEGQQQGDAEAAAAAAAAGGEAKPGEQSKVPLGALQEERTKRQTAEKRMEELGGAVALLLQRLTPGNDGAAPGAAAEVVQKEPTLQEDPFYHLEKLSGALANIEQARQQEAQHRIISERTLRDERDFAAVNPDYPVAMNHLIQTRDLELQAMGYDDPKQRSAIISNDAQTIARGAMAKGKSIAEAVYDLAKLRGYAGKAPPKAEPLAAESKMTMVEDAANAARSLSGGSGAAAAPLSAEALANMSDEDFDRVSEDAFRKAAGG